MLQLRPDNVDEWEPTLFAKADGSADPLFYQQPRRVVHIDNGAIGAVTRLYQELLPTGSVLLDMMSSWRSHLPVGAAYARVMGLGMNGDEMEENPQLSAFTLHDLNPGFNQQATVPFADQEFDAACCCVSVQYLQQPVAVFREVGRVLKPGAPFVVTFSNRCFPSKAINLWRYTEDKQHLDIVALYFAAAGNWGESSSRAYTPVGGDPLYAVWAYAKG
jgi:SAM-dependent methyltransferase